MTAALAFQATQAEYNAQIEDDIQPTVRIGIAMGEVVLADRTVTGAGVVLAQRMEQLAEPGGVCITAAIHESLPQRMPFEKESLGEREVKGFDEPVRVYTVRIQEGTEPPGPAELSRERHSPWIRWTLTAVVVAVICGGGLLAWYQFPAPVSSEDLVLPLPDQPSIAVLPFDDLSPHEPERLLADGITEALISTLGQVEELFVIARKSMMVYRDQVIDIRQVGRELGVRYVLEGSVQQTSHQVRVTAQLIDTKTGAHIWAERYDRPIDDIFLLQDEIALKVLVSLQVHLTDGETARLRSSTTKDVEAYLHYRKGVTVFFTYTKEGALSKFSEATMRRQLTSENDL